ncbi:hypothetical protein Tco_1441195, partial [Tanacetum coccineum]
MIAVNNQKDSVSPLPLSGKKRKVKSHIVTPTLPKNIQLPGTGLPFTSPDEGICKSQLLPEGTITDPKDSRGNVQPADKGLPSMTSNEGTAKTTPHPEGSLGDKDLDGNKPPADMKPINPTIANPLGTGDEYQPDHETLQLTTLADIQAYLLSKDELAHESDEEEVFVAGDDMEEENQADEEEHQSPSPNKDKPEPSHTPATQESDSDSSSPDLKKFDNTLPLTERQLVKYLRVSQKVSRVLSFKKLTEEHWTQRILACEETRAPKRIDKGKKIATDDVESQVKLVPISKVAREDLDELDRELIKKAADQARLLAITKPEVVKVVRKEAGKFGIDPERITSAK